MRHAFQQRLHKLSSRNLELVVASFCSLFRRPFLLLNNGSTRRLAFYLFGIGTDLEAIQGAYFLGAIKALTSQLLNSKNKIPVVDIELYPSSFNICSFLL